MKRMKMRGRTRPLIRLRRYVAKFASAKKSGNKKREGTARMVIGRLVRRFPKLRRSKVYKRYLMMSDGITAGPRAAQGWSPISTTYRPQFQNQAADSAEGEVISDPDDYEDLPDEDEDYDMDGFGKFTLYAEGSDMLQKTLMFAGYGGLVASFFVKKKKTQKQARMVGIGALGLAFARHFMMKKKIAEVGDFGELEIMGNPSHYMSNPSHYGELEIMDGFGDYGAPYAMYDGHYQANPAVI